MNKPSKMGFVEGLKVELKKDYEAYYSGYAGNPVVVIKKGTVGLIGSTDVPYVKPTRDKSRGAYFVCVDFKLPGVFSGNPKFNHHTWRCGVNPKDMKLFLITEG